MRSADSSRAAAGTRGMGIRAHLQLMRPANMVTSMADVLAGFAVGGMEGGAKLPWLLASGLALYGGGVTMNDFFDRRLDAEERPERPIPSGRVSARSAGLLGSGLLLAGIALALLASPVSGAVAAAVAALALGYDAGGKHIPWVGPLTMGSCRGFDLLLGVSAHAAALPVRWYAGLVPLVYIAGVTLLSTGEVHGGTRGRSVFSAGLAGAAALGALAMGWSSWTLLAGAAAILGLLGYRAGPAFYRACVEPDAGRIRAAVKAGVISLVFLDGAIGAASTGWWYGLGLVALVWLVSRLARTFPVT